MAKILIVLEFEAEDSNLIPGPHTRAVQKLTTPETPELRLETY